MIGSLSYSHQKLEPMENQFQGKQEKTIISEESPQEQQFSNSIIDRAHYHLTHKKQPLTVAVSGFSATDERWLFKTIARSLPNLSVLADDIPFSYREKFTHLVFNPLAKPTIKIVYALSRGVWILKPDWIMLLLDWGEPKEEEAYQVEAYQKSNRVRNLFDKLNIFVAKNLSEVLPEDIEELILLNGGMVTRNVSECDLCITDSLVEHYESQTVSQIVPCYNNEDSKETMRDMHLNYSKAPKSLITFANKTAANSLWVIRSILSMKLQEYSEYPPAKATNV